MTAPAANSAADTTAIQLKGLGQKGLGQKGLGANGIRTRSQIRTHPKSQGQDYNQQSQRWI